MVSISQIFKDLEKKVKDSNKPASYIVRIKGLNRLVLQINAVPDNNGNIRYSMTIHSRANYRRQIGVFPDDAGDLVLIGKFLEKYKDELSKYVKMSVNRRSNREEVEIELDEENENNNEKKSTKKDIEEEFEVD